MKNELRTARIEFSIFHFPFVSLIVVEAGYLCTGIVSLDELNNACTYFETKQEKMVFSNFHHGGCGLVFNIAPVVFK